MKANNTNARKKWEQPKLIVLVRGRPEEAVLAVCKRLAPVGGTGFLTDCATMACRTALNS